MQLIHWPPHPAVLVVFSLILAAWGIYLLITRSRRGVGSEPRCHKCDYVLTGISSSKCPECGTLIDTVRARRVRRQRRSFRTVAGLMLITVGAAVSWNPVNQWSDSITWYEYRPTFLVIRDLRSGSGLAAPPNNPLTLIFVNHRVATRDEEDLAGFALEELLRRNQYGKLTPDHMQQLDEIALEHFAVPRATDAQWGLNDLINSRIRSGRLAGEKLNRIFGTAVKGEIWTPPAPVQWDDVPLTIDLQGCLPAGSRTDWRIDVYYQALRVDGKNVELKRDSESKEPDAQLSSDSALYTEQRQLPYMGLGDHRVELDVKIDFRLSREGIPADSGAFLTQYHTFRTSFREIRPSFLAKIGRFSQDPVHEAFHYVPEAGLRSLIRIDTAVLRALATDELIRRDGVHELPQDVHEDLINQLLAMQKDRLQAWRGELGDYIEVQKKENHLTEAQWRQYAHQQFLGYIQMRTQIRQGDPLPIDLVWLPRRGNSTVAPYGFDSLSLECSQPTDVLHSWNLESLDQILTAPHDGADFIAHFLMTAANPVLGSHTIRLKVTDIGLTSTERPLDMTLPTEYDLGKFTFEVVPQTQDVVAAISDATLAGRIASSLVVLGPTRVRGVGLEFNIEVHQPPANLAFRIVAEFGERKWAVGELAAKQGAQLTGDNAARFLIKNYDDVPSTGLKLRLIPDADLARRQATFTSYWAKEVVRNVPIEVDRLNSPQPH